MLGEPVDADTRQNAEALMRDLNAEFKLTCDAWCKRALLKRNAGP